MSLSAASPPLVNTSGTRTGWVGTGTCLVDAPADPSWAGGSLQESLGYFCVVCWHQAADLSRSMSAIILTSLEESWICAQVMLTTRLCCWAPRYLAYPALSYYGIAEFLLLGAPISFLQPLFTSPIMLSSYCHGRVPKRSFLSFGSVICLCFLSM